MIDPHFGMEKDRKPEEGKCPASQVEDSTEGGELSAPNHEDNQQDDQDEDDGAASDVHDKNSFSGYPCCLMQVPFSSLYPTRHY
jgi:hypothetical protein